jgi:hypothetical protein
MLFALLLIINTLSILAVCRLWQVGILHPCAIHGTGWLCQRKCLYVTGPDDGHEFGLKNAEIRTECRPVTKTHFKLKGIGRVKLCACHHVLYSNTVMLNSELCHLHCVG